MPAMVFEDLVLIGPAGSENKIQGWIGAFRMTDGTPVWRFNTVPRRGERGAETWGNSEKFPVGGGAVWTPMSLDVAKGELYVAVTNPAPDMASHLRPGANLYTNSIVALDVRTGRLRWYEQLVPNDARDWDLTQVSPLYRGTVRGKERNLVVTAGKDGMLNIIDRDSHERLASAAVTTRLNTEGPIPKQGQRVCPGYLGGVEWNGPALNPGTNLLYVPAVDLCMTLVPDDSVKFTSGEMYIGGKITPDSTSQGWLTAVDASDGSIRWRYRSPSPMVGAVVTTAGGLVFAGEQTGDLIAFDAASGRELYRMYTGAGIFGGMVTYAVGGTQYLATTTGGGSMTFGRSGSPTIVVFSLRAPAAP
jgi:alcohol dehydrogenase (cytochrome c)